MTSERTRGVSALPVRDERILTVRVPASLTYVPPPPLLSTVRSVDQTVNNWNVAA